MIRRRASISRRILDFDMETRRIGFHSAGKFSPDGCEAVIIAASWSRDDPVEFRSLGRTWEKKDVCAMLDWFRALWDEADVVTGHYIGKFDLPIINGMFFEHEYDPLPDKPYLDTHNLKKMAGLSKSQENLSEMFDIGSKKFHMNDTLWREVARLTRYGLDEAQKRVVDDVRQHQGLTYELSSGKWLKDARVWRS